jgi:cathepsin B
MHLRKLIKCVFFKFLYPLQEDIQREILTQGPVQAIFRVHADFFMYKSGVYEPFRPHQSDPVDAYHSVKLLGWGIENEVPYWV